MSKLKEDSPTPKRGISGDLQRIKAGTAATNEELREFMRKLKGKRPQEVMGLVAQSGLFQGVALATIGCVVLIGTMTVVPFVWGRVFGGPADGTSATVKAATDATSESNPQAAHQDADAGSADPGGAEGGKTASTPSRDESANSKNMTADEKLLDKLDMESKASDPDSNPLEDSAEDLLNDLK